MPHSAAVVPTENASRYLQQLCKHFGHKIPVSFTPEHGECRFSCGTAKLDATDGQLRIAVEAPDAEQLAQTQDVVASHLVRFAFREEIEPISWLETRA